MELDLCLALLAPLMVDAFEFNTRLTHANTRPSGGGCCAVWLPSAPQSLICDRGQRCLSQDECEDEGPNAHRATRKPVLNSDRRATAKSMVGDKALGSRGSQWDRGGAHGHC